MNLPLVLNLNAPWFFLALFASLPGRELKITGVLRLPVNRQLSVLSQHPDPLIHDTHT